MSIANGYGPNWTTEGGRVVELQRRVVELEQQLAAAQAEAREWQRVATKQAQLHADDTSRLEAEARELRERSAHVDRAATRLAVEKDTLAQELAWVREIVSGMREYADSCDHPSEASKRYAMEYWLAQLEDAISQPAEQHDPLAVSDLCGERESLPLMARRPRHKDDDLGELYENGKRLCTISGEPPLREPMPGFVLYRIADTDEHGLKVIPRTADMPEGAKYRLTWIMQADAAGGEVEYTDSLPLALEANRSGAVSERIEDYRESGQEGKE